MNLERYTHSYSSANSFMDNKSAWILRYILKHSSPTYPAFGRGLSAEFGAYATLKRMSQFKDTKSIDEIRNMAKTYRFLEKEVLPQLRRSTITINYEQVGYSDEELKNLVATNPDTLNVEEIFQACLNEDDLNTKLRNYNEAERLFSNDWRLLNNKGYLLYTMGDIDGAGQSFEKALSITDNATVSNNYAAVKHRQLGKSSDEIKSYFEKYAQWNLNKFMLENDAYYDKYQALEPEVYLESK